MVKLSTNKFLTVSFLTLLCLSNQQIHADEKNKQINLSENELKQLHSLNKVFEYQTSVIKESKDLNKKKNALKNLRQVINEIYHLLMQKSLHKEKNTVKDFILQLIKTEKLVKENIDPKASIGLFNWLQNIMQRKASSWKNIHSSELNKLILKTLEDIFNKNQHKLLPVIKQETKSLNETSKEEFEEKLFEVKEKLSELAFQLLLLNDLGSSTYSLKAEELNPVYEDIFKAVIQIAKHKRASYEKHQALYPCFDIVETHNDFLGSQLKYNKWKLSPEEKANIAKLEKLSTPAIQESIKWTSQEINKINQSLQSAKSDEELDFIFSAIYSLIFHRDNLAYKNFPAARDIKNEILQQSSKEIKMLEQSIKKLPKAQKEKGLQYINDLHKKLWHCMLWNLKSINNKRDLNAVKTIIKGDLKRTEARLSKLKEPLKKNKKSRKAYIDAKQKLQKEIRFQKKRLMKLNKLENKIN